ncbi:mannitol 2-dehydrogenase [Marisediminicola sp. UYEF4]|uniref:mannitol dehydrogenase family protein n=1 Tax=Marisediminicola sp. UYEF4 TaxID=1756384 RepID=UPI003393D5B1
MSDESNSTARKLPDEREAERGLSNGALATLPSGIGRPIYDRVGITAGIVHVGVGGFHRAHMAMSIDRLMNAGGAKKWGICGVGLLEGDRRMKEIFEEQDCLYSLIVKHPDGRREVTVIGSILEYLFAPEDQEAVIEKMAGPGIEIVSLTITEGGYNFDRVTGEFDAATPVVVGDLVPGAVPTTVFGFVTEALRRRRERGIAPFTVLSCDNIQGNGHMAREMFTAFARLKDPELGAWIAQNVKFPNSMVDRITPVTSTTDIEEAAVLTGVRDAWPVVCEPFFQWVIEDDFGMGRPAFDEVDAQFVVDVEPYELMKLRLLNASHQALCYFGFLGGYRYAHEATSDPAIAAFLARYMDREATPTLRPVPGIDLDRYKHTLIERFSNPEVRDTLARLCAESSDRIPKWLVPVIRAQLKSGGEIDCSAAIVASWARYAEAVDEQGEPIEVVDSLRDELIAIARTQRENPLAFIENTRLFGDLATSERFSAAYRSALRSLVEHGALATVRTFS